VRHGRLSGGEKKKERKRSEAEKMQSKYEENESGEREE
jgi:hypothetical protein